MPWGPSRCWMGWRGRHLHLWAWPFCLCRDLEAQGVGYLRMRGQMGNPREWLETMPRGVLREVGIHRTLWPRGQHGDMREQRKFARNNSFSYECHLPFLKSGSSQAVLWYRHRRRPQIWSPGTAAQVSAVPRSSDLLDPENVNSNSSSSSSSSKYPPRPVTHSLCISTVLSTDLCYQHNGSMHPFFPRSHG